MLSLRLLEIVGQKLKEAIETICELNHDLLRPERAATKRGGKSRD
jgi:hypothetical protein